MVGGLFDEREEWKKPFGLEEVHPCQPQPGMETLEKSLSSILQGSPAPGVSL